MSTLEILINAEDKASSKLNDVGKALDNLDKKTSGMDATFGKLQKTISVGVVGAVAGLGAGLAATTAVIADGVGKAADLEQGVADIAAVMGLAVEEVAPLKDLIVDLGMDPTLKVNATEASDAIMQLAQSGISMSDIMDGAAKNVVLLSNATGGDMALSAAIASDAMSLFGISAQDMATAVNQITGVTVASKFGIQDYQYALAAVGGVASTLGVSFSDLNTTIAAISPSFASGSDAGTSLKTMLSRLVPASSDAKNAMREIGLFSGLTADEMTRAEKEAQKLQTQIGELDPTSAGYAEKSALLNQQLQNVNASMIEGQNAFFNVDGSMKSMSEISGLLQASLANLSDEQKVTTLNTIFGSDAIRAASSLANIGSVEFDKLAASIAGVDADQSAATRMDTFSGALEIMQGVIDGLLIGIGDAFLPLLRVLVEMFTQLADTHGPAIIAMFRSLSEQLIATGQWFSEFLRTGNLLNDSIFKLNPNLQQMILFISSIAAPIQAAVDQIENLIIQNEYWKDILIAVGIVLTATVLPALVTLVSAMAPVIAVFAAIVVAVRLLREAFESNFGGIRDFIQNVSNILITTYNNIRDGTWTLQEGIGLAFNGIVHQIQQFLPGWIEILQDWGKAVWEWIAEVTPVAIEKLKEWGGALVGWVRENLPGWIAQLKTWGAAIWQWLVEVTPVAIEKLKEWGRALVGWVRGNLPGWIAQLKTWGAAIWQWLVEVTPIAIEKLKEWGGALLDWLIKNLPGWIAQLYTWAAALVSWITGIVPNAIAALTEFIQNLSTTGEEEGGKSFVDMVKEWGAALISTVGPEFAKFVVELTKLIVNLGLELIRLGITLGVSLLLGLAEGLLDLAGIEVDLDEVKETIFDNLNKGIDTAKRVGTNLIEAVQDGLSGDDAGLGKVIDNIFGVFEDEWGDGLGNWINNAIPATLDELKKWRDGMKEWLTDNLPGWSSAVNTWQKGLSNWITNEAPNTLTTLGTWRDGMATWLATNLPGWSSAVNTWQKGLSNWITNEAPNTLTTLGTWRDGMTTWLTTNLPGWKTSVDAWGAGLKEWITNQTPGTQLGTWRDGMTRWLTTNLPGWKTSVDAWGAGLREWITNQTPGTQLGTWRDGMTTWLTTNLPGWKTSVDAWGAGLREWITNQTPGTQLGTWRDGMTRWLTENLPKWKTSVGAWGAGLKDWITSTEAIKKFETWLTDIRNWAVGPDGKGGAIHQFAHIANLWMDGILGSLGKKLVEISNFITQGFQAIIDAVKRIFNIKSPSKVMYDIGANLMMGMEIGISKKIPAVVAAAQLMADGVMGVTNGMSLSPSLALASTALGSASTGNIIRPSVTNNATYNLNYQTMQSAGSVQQDVELLNLLYGGTV